MPKKIPKILKDYKDSDADGLSDALEKEFGTDPNQADSDHDGLNDYEEINVYETDPLNPDSDGDGVNDGDEIKQGRNPKGAGLLKDLFIPYAGNNYQPKALNPYRLFFYALSSILFKVILIGAVIILPIEAWLTPDISLKQSRKIISLTNSIRKNLNLALLAESSLLDQAAYNKVADMLLNQYFSHIGPDNKTLADWLRQMKYNYSVAGENLAMGFASPEEVVNGWTRSRTHYKNMIDPDFKEIGVGMTSGLFNKIDTVLVAQYFAASQKRIVMAKNTVTPPKISIGVAAPPAVAVKQETIAMTAPQAVLGEKAIIKPASNIELIMAGELMGSIPPQVDLSKSKLYIDQPQGQDEIIVRAEVYLSADVAKAQVDFNNYVIDLREETPLSGKWVGQTIIFEQDQKQAASPLVLPVVTAEDRMGNRTTVDLEWNNIKPSNSSVLEQYLFMREHQPLYTKPLFDVTSIYYKFILLIASIALALNILIEIKKQYPHIIFSTLGLILLLIFLIII